MNKTLLLLLAALSAPAFAHSDARLNALEARIDYLEKRIALLEQNQNRHQNIIIEHRSPSNRVYICKLSVFGKDYEASDKNEGLARLAVKKACRKTNDGIFCQEHDIRCKKFD
ncbi:carbohydrate porin [Neisseria weaveri]|uniref:Periplasmic protein n=1 Tax=Neisseria weaveri TaxID=28091 RepID=A0A3S5F9I6_9NEIS|nr:carbohydrate porin [Neisseria weaveri]EGV37057.1 hypothetical protein l11_14180 [Neisseria weaveri LMG 5135]VEJ49750.1 Periplasmic protein [Neisseria weaveri]